MQDRPCLEFASLSLAHHVCAWYRALWPDCQFRPVKSPRQRYWRIARYDAAGRLLQLERNW